MHSTCRPWHHNTADPAAAAALRLPLIVLQTRFRCCVLPSRCWQRRACRCSQSLPCLHVLRVPPAAQLRLQLEAPCPWVNHSIPPADGAVAAVVAVSVLYLQTPAEAGRQQHRQR